MGAAIFKTTGLTVKENVFAKAILNGKSYKLAAIASGSSEKSASVTASRYMKRGSRVREAIERAQLSAKLAAERKAGTNKTWVLEQARLVYERVVQAVEPALHRNRPVRTAG